jgi:hypothetical protein
MAVLAHLTTSGWVLFAVTAAAAFTFVLRILARDLRSSDTHVHAAVLACLLVWLLYLVTL